MAAPLTAMNNRSFALIALSLITGVLSTEPKLIIFPALSEPSINVGQSYVFTCKYFVDDPNLLSNLQWLDTHNHTIQNDNPKYRGVFETQMMQNEYSFALIISAMKKEYEGTYTCMANYASSTPLYASVRVRAIVGITWENAPEDQFPRLGSNYKVKCEVRADPSPHIQWYINGNPVSENSERHVISSNGLLIKNVQESDDGVYTCRVHVMETGAVQSRNIKVEVQIPPRIDPAMPTTMEFVDGEEASITCLGSGKPAPRFKWIHGLNQKDLAVASDRFSVNDVTGVLTIKKVTRDDNGSFKCLAQNGAGSAEATVRVTVIIKPDVQEIRNVSVPVGNTSRLECRATGNPLPLITFRKLSSHNKFIAGVQPTDNRIIVDQSEDRERRQAVGALIISPLQMHDDGLYACIARNKGGESIKNGHIQVESAPSFANSVMREAWSWARKPVNLSCIAESIPNATISWRLNRKDIDQDPNFRIYGRGYESTLLVTPTDRYFYGTYSCIAKNKYGEAEHEISLKEATIPSEIQQADLKIITATTITFSFIEPASSGGRLIKAYIVNYKEEREPWSSSRNKSWPVGSPYILEGLEPQLTYNFRFAAVNDVGRGNWAASKSHTMPKRSAPEEPIILNTVPPTEDYVISPYADRFEIRWKKPADNGEPIKKYQIRYCTISKSNEVWSLVDQSCQELVINAPEMTSADVTDLIPDTYYVVELRAENNIGFSSPGKLYIKTGRDPIKAGAYPGDQSPSTSAASYPMSFKISSSLLFALSTTLLVLH